MTPNLDQDELKEIVLDPKLPADRRARAYRNWLFTCTPDWLKTLYRGERVLNLIFDHYFELVEDAMRAGIFVDEGQEELGPVKMIVERARERATRYIDNQFLEYVELAREDSIEDVIRPDINITIEAQRSNSNDDDESSS